MKQYKYYREWIRILRDPNTKQAFENYEKDGAYCAIGALSLARKRVFKKKIEGYYESASLLVMKMVGVKTLLVHGNDNLKIPLPIIADFLEAHEEEDWTTPFALQDFSRSPENAL